MAAETASSPIVRLLLDHGADLNPRPGQKWSLLFGAVRENSADVVKLLLDMGCNPHDRDHRMKTPLFWAAFRGDHQKVEHLMYHGADINARDEHLETPLMSAAGEGTVSTVEFMLHQGSNVADEDIAGNTALFHAAKGGHKEVVLLLLENGANIHHRNVVLDTPLFWAAAAGQAAVAEILLTHGAEADLRNMFLETPFLYATSEAHTGQEEYTMTVELLVERGADVDPICRDTGVLGAYDVLVLIESKSATFLDSMVDLERESIVRKYWGCQTQSFDRPQLLAFLRQLTLSATATGSQESLFRKPHTLARRRKWQVGKATPLIWATDRRCKELVSMFLRRDVRVDIRDEGGRTALMNAVKLGDTQMISLFLTPGLKGQPTHVEFEQLIQLAARNGHSAAIRLLLSKTTIDDTVGSSALLSSARCGNREAVRLLLDKGYAADTQDKDGQNAFHHSAIDGSQEIVNMLIEANAPSFDAKDNHGRTPLFWAVQNQHLSVAVALLRAGADPNAMEQGGSSPILFEGLDPTTPKIPPFPKSRDARDLMRKREALMNRAEPGGQTPLFSAAGSGHHSITKILLDHGANPNVKNKYGETALCWAAGLRCEITVRLLLDRGAFPGPVGNSTQAPLLWAVGSQGHGFIDARIWRELTWNPFGHSPSDPDVIVRILLKHGANPNFHTRGVEPILSAALSTGNKSLIRRLVKVGCDPNLQSEDGETPLYRAAAMGLEDLVQFLCAHGANPNLANRFGRTPLMVATVRGHWTCVLELLAVGTVNKDATDVFGRSASSEARLRGAPLVKNVLLDGYDNLKTLKTLDVQQTIPKLRERYGLTLGEPSIHTRGTCDACDIETHKADTCDICADGNRNFCQECHEAVHAFEQQESSNPII
ncbi:ankyrin repeat-containing domain protein [Penicillium cataractarum]|uniref:Ankyrin repeat-containing domain protein n=1 Tax=Penicillium cataractarum TaxID=2100454 RepID=A0A9W9RQL6_9EURO|nr:ankyrin repeat-containing domain protein [Penicillium cataractarum]KAJ5364610.1 ankyrin repeat-containing domain protein [Penicillium cataractarum]